MHKGESRFNGHVSATKPIATLCSRIGKRSNVSAKSKTVVLPDQCDVLIDLLNWACPDSEEHLELIDFTKVEQL